MPAVIIGGQTFRIRTAHCRGSWTASAVRTDNGDRFGAEFSGPTEGDAIAGVTRWLEWQRDHAAALEVLQDAERAYHRSIAGQAFAGATDGAVTLQARRRSLDEVEQARVRLDCVRARRPALPERSSQKGEDHGHAVRNGRS